jgi:epoxyqueuosine reductase
MDTYEVTLFAFNPNIHPEAEYQHRLRDVKKMAAELGIEVIEGAYHPQDWLQAVKGFEEEKEGGARCAVCFRHRLEETGNRAKKNGYDLFATTLTTGRNKKADVINPLGAQVASKLGIPFLAKDFKKNAIRETSMLRCETLGIIRQHYCGCVFSRKETEQAKKS